jgi:AcrR family transcriptional regulator
MNGYEKRTQLKRDRIVNTAQGLFFRHGIAGVTVEQIAEQAQVSRVTIFKYFGDKDGLAREAVRAWARALLAGLDSLLECDSPFSEKLAQAFSVFERIRDETISRDIRSDRDLQACIYNVMKDEGLPRILALVGQGKHCGDIDAALDDRAILLYFSAFRTIISDPDYVKTDRAVQDSLFRMFMRGLLRDWRGA